MLGIVAETGKQALDGLDLDEQGIANDHVETVAAFELNALLLNALEDERQLSLPLGRDSARGRAAAQAALVRRLQ